jgi:UDPglucose--hexose-1-phosphate uridylyltransferase
MSEGHANAARQSTPDLRRDPISGRFVVIAPARSRRPGAKRGELEPPTQAELDECPFDEGREDRTPPETYAVGPAGRAPNTPGWQVRVVPNLYPALEHQEVVVHSPRHVRSLAELDEDELRPIANAWAQRAEAAQAAGFPYLQILLNEGREAGASLPHSHSQLVWMREPPPAAVVEFPNLERNGCAVCRLIADESLFVAEHEGTRTFAAPAGRMPYELVIAPVQHRPNADEDLLTSALTLVRDAILRLRKVEGPLPLNAWVHAGAHWHVEVLPRTSVLAGLELGAGIFVNSLPAEQAAEALRASGRPV